MRLVGLFQFFLVVCAFILFSVLGEVQARTPETLDFGSHSAVTATNSIDIGDYNLSTSDNSLLIAPPVGLGIANNISLTRRDGGSFQVTGTASGLGSSDALNAPTTSWLFSTSNFLATITVEVVASSNNAPTDIALSSTAIIDSATSSGAVVGGLTTTDFDSVDTHTYSLSTSGSTCTTANGAGNGSFDIDNTNDELETSGAVTAGSYNICINVNDGTDDYQETFTIAVSAANNNPTASNFTFPNNVRSGNVTMNWKTLSSAADADGDSLSASVLTDGSKGVAVVSGDNVTYTPGTNQSGQDTFVLRISDTNSGTVDITVTVNGISTNNTAVTSGANFATLALVYAVDAYGNIDLDFANNVTLSESGNGNLYGTPTEAASSGTASFASVNYRAAADQETFVLTATDTGGSPITSGTSGTITADVQATTFAFNTEPAPTSINSGQSVDFSTDPIVHAVDAQGGQDTDYTSSISLEVVNGVGAVSSLTGDGDTDAGMISVVLTASGGAATFTNLNLQYTTGADETINLRADDNGGGLSSADSTNISVIFDSTPPTVSSIVVNGTPAGNATSVTFDVMFSESVTGVDVADFSLGGSGASGNIDGLSGAGTNYQVTVSSITGDGSLRLDVDASGTGILDSANNALNGGFTSGSTHTVDQTAPIVSITSTLSGSTNQSGIPLTVTFSEPVSGFTVSDLDVSNGLASGFSTTDDTLFSVNISPASDGEVTVDINASVATDSAGNNNTAASQFSITSDVTAPTVSVSSTLSGVVNNNPIPVTFTFSEAVSGFSESDLSITNGSASGFSTTDNTVFSVNIAPVSDGEVTVDINTSVATDSAGNNNTAASQFSITSDVTAPAVSVGSTLSGVVNNNPIPVTITFSEAVSGFTESDLSITNGSTSGFSTTDNTVFSVNIAPASDGEVTVDINTSVVTDSAGNNNTAASQFSITSDLTAPTVSIVSTLSGATNQSSIPLTITFSEAVSGFTESDLSITNGSASGFSTTDNTMFSLNIAPVSDGEVTVDINTSVATDSAGNNNTAAIQFSITSDVTAPTVSVTSTLSGLTNQSSIPLTVTFSEPVSGFTVSELSVSNGSASGFATTNNTVFSVNIAPDGDGPVTVDVNASVATDSAGNNNTAAIQFSITSDVTAPTVSVTSTLSGSTNQSGIPLTVTFSEPVSGFTVSDLAVSNGSASGFATTDNTVFSVNIAPASDGEVTVDINTSVATDSAGNNNTAASQFSITSDVTAPTVSVTSTLSGSTNQSSIPLAVTFSEPVSGFTVSDLAVSNGSASGFSTTDNTVFSVNIAPDGDGEVTVDINASVTTDSAGNNNTAASQFSITSDVTAPTVSVTSTLSGSTNQSGIPLTVIFSEPVSGFTVSDLAVSNGSASGFSATDNTVFSVNITPAADGEVTVDVNASVATDAAGNSNTAASQFSITSDVTSPAASIASTLSDVTNQSSIPLIITFSEVVSGFTVSDLAISNGSASGFSTTDNTVFSVNITPAADGEVTVDVNASVATDTAGNNNVASNSFSITYDATAPAGPVVSLPGGIINVNSGAQTLSGTHSENGVTVHAYLDADNNGSADNTASLGSATVSGNEWSFSVSLTADTANNFVVQSVDGSGNVSGFVNVPTITQDSTIPSAPVVSSPANAIFVNAATQIFSGTHTEDAVTVHAYLDADNNGIADSATTLGSAVVSSNTWSFSVSLTDNAVNDFVVQSVDSSGNVSGFVDVPTITEDSIAPVFDASGSVPADDSTNTAVGNSIILKFNENVLLTTGQTVTLLDVTNNSVQEVFTANASSNASGSSGGEILLSGTEINVNPGTNLLAGTNYAIQYGATSITDRSGNAATEVTDNTTYNTTTIPELTISAAPTAIFEQAAKSTFTVQLQDGIGRPFSADSTVSATVTFTGTATPGNSNDYTILDATQGSIVSLEGGQSSATFGITSIDDGTTGEGPETVIVTISSPEGYGIISNVASATVTINENGLPIASEVPTTQSIDEDTLTNLTLSTITISDIDDTKGTLSFVTDSGTLSSPLDDFNGVTVSGSGTAALTLSGDFDDIVTFLDNENAVAITPVADSNNAIHVTITPGDDTTSGSGGTLVITVVPVNDHPTLLTNFESEFDMSGSLSAGNTIFTEEDSGITMTAILDSGTWNNNASGGGDSIGDSIYVGATESSNVTFNFTHAITVSSFLHFVNGAPDSGTFTYTPTGGAATNVTQAATDVASGITITPEDWRNITSFTVTSDGGAFNPAFDTLSYLTPISLPGSLTFTEETQGNVDLSAFSFDDVDNNAITVTLNVTGGLFGSPADGSEHSVIETQLSSTNITLQGSPTNIAAYLDSVSSINFTGNQDVQGDGVGILSILADDGKSGNITLATLSINIANVNDAPLISGTPATSVNENGTFSFTPSVADVDSTSFSFSITGQPSWASFNTLTGELSGSPVQANVGMDSNIVITVSDGDLTASMSPFSIQVVNVADAPVITSGGFAISVIEDGQAAMINMSASDLDGDNLSWVVDNSARLGTASVIGNNGSATISYLPIANLNGDDSFTVTVSDGVFTASQSITVSVAAVNDVPTISGTPPTAVLSGSAYRFTPQGSDVDGDSLSWSAVNLPGFLTVSATTGVLSGTPSRGDIGEYTDIVITVSDGTLQASLPAFTLRVADNNRAPVIDQGETIEVTMSEDGSPDAFTLSLSATDSNNDSLVWSATTPNNGQASVSDSGVVSYVPITDFNGQDSFDVSVTDGIVSDSIAVAINVSAVNDVPTISGTPPTAVLSGSAYRFTPQGSDVDGDSLSWSAVNLPGFLTVSATTGVLSGTPSRGDIGEYTDIVITVSDGTLQASLPAFTLRVADNNRAPVIDQGETIEVTMSEDGSPDAFTLSLSATDSNNDILVWSATTPNNGQASVSDSGVVSYVPITDFNGQDSFDVSVTDGIVSDSIAVAINVSAVNDVPTISGTPPTAALSGSAYRFTPQGSDVDGDSLSWSAVNLPGFLTVSATTGVLSGTPSRGDIGEYTDIVITVSDGTLQAILPAFTLRVADNNRAPVIDQGETIEVTMSEDGSPDAFTLSLSATDSNNDSLVWSATTPNNGQASVSASGVVSYVPITDFNGQDSFDVSVTDGIVSDSITVTVNVSSVNDVPIISGIPDTIIKVGSAYSFAATASDVENDMLTFTIANQPRWSDFDGNSGMLTGTPGASDAGTYGSVTISVSDGIETVSLSAFDIDVLANNSPIISGNTATRIEVGSNFIFNPDASDADGDRLLFSIVGRPDWSSFDSETGALSGVPSTADVGISRGVVISVTDGIETVSLPVFDLEVCNVCGNVAPVINGAPATTVLENSAYKFVPQVTDSNGDELVFSISVLPIWASFDNVTGTLAGTPVSTDVGTTPGIVISVSDGELSVSLPAFDITVLEINDLPVISGTPSQSVFQGDEYRFTPVAIDSDGDTLRFNIHNLPVWASFNQVTGTLRGIPEATDVGSYEGVQLSVTDNTNEPVLLPAFTINVLARNTAPVISGQPRTHITQGSRYTFTPQASDDDGDVLTFSVTNPPTWASFDALSGELTGTPGAIDVGFHENIVMSVTDGTDIHSLPMFGITVTAANTAPVTENSSVSMSEDTSAVIIASVTDSDGDTLTFQVTEAPINGSLMETQSGWFYTPEADFTGIDSFTFMAHDGELQSNASVVNVSVESVNDAPIALDDTFVVQQMNSGIYSLDVLANDSDVDIKTSGDSLTLQGAESNFGVVTIEGEQLQVDVGSSFIGTATVEYSVRDNSNVSVSARAILTINGVSDIGAPVLTVPGNVNVDATGLFTRVDLGVASATDAEGNPLPVSISSGTNTFSPGLHTVFWQAEDRFGTKTTESQQVIVNPLISVGDSQVVAEGASVFVPIILNGDAPAYPFTVNYSITGSATPGVDHDASSGAVTFLEGTREQLVRFNVFVDGEVEIDETLFLSLDDGQNIGATSQTTISISEANIAPEIILEVTQSQQSRLSVARDEGPVNITAVISDQNSQDTLAIEWSSIIPNTNNSEDRQFDFMPEDLATGVYEVTLFVSDDGEPVLSATDSVFIAVVDTLAMLSESVDSDGDLIPDAQEGYADLDGDGIPDYLDAIDDCNVVPEQADTQNGFLVESDPGVCMRRGAISALNESDGLQVIAENTARPRVKLNKLGESVSFLAANLPEDSGAENTGGVFDFILYNLPQKGQSVQVVFPQVLPVPAAAVYRKFKDSTQRWVDFVINDQNAVYSTTGEPGSCPPPGNDVWVAGLTEGHWCVQLQIEDGGPNDDDGLVNSAIVDPGGVAVVLENNRLPKAVGDTIEMQWNTSVEIDVLSNDLDPDGDALAVVNVSSDFGLASITDDELISFTPAMGFIGEASIVYAISDGNNGTGSATVTVTINGNRAPGAIDDVSMTDDVTPVEIDVLANDIDVDGDELTLVNASAETGMVEVTANQTLLYAPPFDFEGTDAVTYIVSDSFGEKDTGLVSVSVVIANRGPVANDDSVTAAFETSVVIDVRVNDTDADSDLLSIVEATANIGLVIINSDNTLTYMPNPGFVGSDNITYTITDGRLNASAQVTVIVEAEPIEIVTVTNRSSGGGSIFWLLMAGWLLVFCQRKADIKYRAHAVYYRR